MTKKENQIFFNQSFDKKRLKALISWVFKKYGEAEALKVLDLLKETGFRNATKAGISIGLHDLTTPVTKSWLISESQQSMNNTEIDFLGAKITATERSQRIIDTWHRASESLSKQVVDYFNIYDRFNPVYIMALSGARGNFSQVRQLIGMRGLMADQQGKIVNFPIRSNLREGLTIIEYFISCSGARKGLVDTALRTADTGYLTRRLVDVSHHVVVKRIRCNTSRGIQFKDLQSYNKILLSLKERLVGRVLAEDISVKCVARACSAPSCSSLLCPTHAPLLAPHKSKICVLPQRGTHSNRHEGTRRCTAQQKKANNLLAKKDTEISPKLSAEITQHRNKVLIRSPLTCGLTHEVCQLCYGWSISQGSLVSLGDAVGVIAAQSIGEPGTQLTMRTFHTGGVFSGDLLQEIRAPHAGQIEFPKAFQGLLIRTGHGRIAFLSKTPGSLILKNYARSKAPSCIFDAQPRSRAFSCRAVSPHTDCVLCPPGKVRATKGARVWNKEGQGGTQQAGAPSETHKSLVSQPESLFKVPHQSNFSCVAKERLDVKVCEAKTRQPNYTTIPIQPFTMLFVRQNEKVGVNQLLAEFSIQSKEGNQPIKTQQTIFAELSGRVVEDYSGKTYLKYLKESSFLVDNLQHYLSQLVQSPQKYDLYSPKSLAQKVHKQVPLALVVQRAFDNKETLKTHAECKPIERPQGQFLTSAHKQSNAINQFLTLYKREDLENDTFRYVEPVKSGRLGLLKILSIRIGATFNYTCPIQFSAFSNYLQNLGHFADGLNLFRLCYEVDKLALQSLHLCPHTCVPRSCRASTMQVVAPEGHARNSLLCRACRASSCPEGTQQVGATTCSYGARQGGTRRCAAHTEHTFSVSRASNRECGPMQEGARVFGVESKNNNSLKSFKNKKPLCVIYTKDGNEDSCGILTLKGLKKKNSVNAYLHPELVKENRFFLQTIAEYGDIVEEEYKNKTFKSS